MFVFNQKEYEIISSKFTRQKGYSEIISSNNYSHKDAINILNSFTPQGSSPQISIRIGMFKDKIGAGYYFMLDEKSAKMSTILYDFEVEKYNLIDIPIDEHSTKDIAFGNYEAIFKKKNYSESFLTKFSRSQFNSILFSLLVGDNIIILHHDHQKRIEFISLLLNFIPGVLFNYNRITTDCSELAGNENIIGIAELPKEYRSHKKVYLPLDTIFIDLEEIEIVGEGLKKCSLTQDIFDKFLEDKDKGRNEIIKLMSKITDPNFTENNDYDEPSNNLIRKMQEKLQIREKTQNWLMSF